MQPNMKYRRIYNEGRKACKEGKTIEDNPFSRFPITKIAYSTWWQKGYLEAKERQ